MNIIYKWHTCPMSYTAYEKHILIFVCTYKYIYKHIYRYTWASGFCLMPTVINCLEAIAYCLMSQR